MSSLIELYVVDEHKLSVDGIGSDRERYERLVAEVRERGAPWHELELPLRDFVRSLQEIDAEIGARNFLPIFAFNNSPGNVLGDAGDCPDFGYFTPKATEDLAILLSQLTPSRIEQLSRSDLTSRIYAAFLDSAEEAARRSCALAVLHDAPTLAQLRATQSPA